MFKDFFFKVIGQFYRLPNQVEREKMRYKFYFKGSRHRKT